MSQESVRDERAMDTAEWPEPLRWPMEFTDAEAVLDEISEAFRRGKSTEEIADQLIAIGNEMKRRAL